LKPLIPHDFCIFVTLLATFGDLYCSHVASFLAHFYIPTLSLQSRALSLLSLSRLLHHCKKDQNLLLLAARLRLNQQPTSQSLSLVEAPSVRCLGAPQVQEEGHYSRSRDWVFFRSGKIGEKSWGISQKVWEKIKRKLRSDGFPSGFFIDKVRNS
jgi:hypothetical protein